MTSAAANMSRYCTNSRATNVDETFAGDSTASISLKFACTDASIQWGLREFVFIEYLCELTTCATCDGDQSDDCFTCADDTRVVYSYIASGTSG